MFISIKETNYPSYTLHTLIDSAFQAQYISEKNCAGSDLIKIDIKNIIVFYSARNLNVGKNIYLYLMWMINEGYYSDIDDIFLYLKEEDKNQIMSYIGKYTNLT